MRDNTEKLGFELDVHWIQRAGANPIEVIKEYDGRVSLLHLKDYRIGRLDLTPEELADYDKFMKKFVEVIEFAEVGEGNLDMKGIIRSEERRVGKERRDEVCPSLEKESRM